MKRTRLLAFLLFFSFARLSHGSDNSEGEFVVKDMIIHHVLDGYSWHILTYQSGAEEHHVSIPLPVILYTDAGIVTFLSSEFEHTPNGTVEKKGLSFQISHGHIKELSGTSVIDISITKNVVSMFLAFLLLVIVFSVVANGYRKRGAAAPKGIQNLMESLIDFLIDDVAKPNIGKNYLKYVPFLLSLFFFIFFNNLMGLIPTGANSSGNISFTLALAVMSLIVILLSSRSYYWQHILSPPGIPFLVKIILVPVEILGIFTKPFALMIRLFANITAGHIVILSLVSIIFIFKNALLGLPIGVFVIALTFLELFVAILQAYIFTLLTALFIGQALEEAH